MSLTFACHGWLGPAALCAFGLRSVLPGPGLHELLCYLGIGDEFDLCSGGSILVDYKVASGLGHAGWMAVMDGPAAAVGWKTFAGTSLLATWLHLHNNAIVGYRSASDLLSF